MAHRISIPADFARQSLPARLRYFAEVHKAMSGPNHNMIADLEEAATEIELGQRTKLTYRGAEVGQFR